MEALQIKSQRQFESIKKQADDLLQKKSSTKVKIYVDGCFDLMHAGHYNALRQCRTMGDYLCAGVNSDADILKTKGPSILNDKERCEIVRHCKFIDDVLPKSPYTPSFETLKQVDCGYFAHGDDPCIDSEGVDIT